MSETLADEKKMTVKTNLTKGQSLESGFKVLDIVELEELKSLGIWAKHEKTGAEVFHVLNDDSENLFSFAFATFPTDSTGAAHILEHSVLCGSENYPLRDAFLVLAQGSLHTFLNAMTFPDKTVYPASSVNERDYFNLMSVYGDAVFRPLIPEWTFMQEGHRKEYDKEGRLSITGVVYNEMKGAYSSLDAFAGFWSVKAVMPGTPYAFDSGGDPECIPGLSWEGLKEFHRSRYSPANCRVFLAGNIPTEKQLSFLNERFFSRLEGGKASEPIQKTKRWEKPETLTVPCPAGSDSKLTVFLSWLCSDVTDTDENLALGALAEILLGHDGSPLTKTLIESGLGEDITPVSGMESEIRETLFVAGLKGVSGEAGKMGKAVEELIMGELRRLVAEGIPAEETEAALLNMEFSQREIRRAGGPFSLVWLRRSLQGWLHGCKPWESLLLNPAMAKIKERLAADKRYFEKLIQKYMIGNPHRALVILEPQKDFLPEKEEKLAQSLAEIEKKMSEDERRETKEKSQTLEKIQNAGDSAEALASIPHLSRKDLSPEPDYVPRSFQDLHGIPALCHELYTNGITYLDLAFPADALSREDYLWLPFFTGAAVSVGLPGLDYAKVSNMLARTVGGFNAILLTGSAVKGANPNLQTASGVFDLAGRDWIIYRLKCLDEKIAPSLDLAFRLITEADFTDERRIRDLVLEMKSSADAKLAPMGHMFASGRAGRFSTRSRQVEELWHGISQIEFAHRLAEYETPRIIEKLKSLQKKIAGAGLIANLTGSALEAGGKELEKCLKGFTAPIPRDLKSETFNFEDAAKSAGEVFASPSLQVGFAAITFPAAPYDTPEQIAETVLTHQLSTGALWEDIRMKGGAYGAFVSSNSLEDCVSFATYRDPDPLRSLDAISSILKTSSLKDNQQIQDEDNLVKTIIGCYSKETQPKTAAESSYADFIRFLYCVEDCHRKRRLERMIKVTTRELADAFQALASRKPSAPVIITGAQSAEKAAKALGTEARMLPV
ncbi:MAG: insulinase family protein [Treponema sp.]|jgi:Zn-dependent M16 (insulinase) family peptidase|nr:insulinase family protein [Treponema sp.]